MKSQTKRLLIAVALFAAVGGYFVWTRTGVAPVEPADFSTLDQEIAENIRGQLQLVKTSPRDQEERDRLGMIYEANALYDLAKQTYQQSLDQAESGRIWFRKAICEERLGNLENAIEAMENCTRLQADFAPGWWRLGMWLLDIGETDRAEQAAKRAMKIDGKDDAVWFLQTRLLLERNENEAAIKTIDEHQLLRSSNGSYAMFLLGTALRQSGEAKKAEPFLAARNVRPVWSDEWTDEVREYEAGLPRIHTAVNQLIRQGKAKQAIPLLQQARQQDANNVTTLNLLGVCYFQLRQMPEAAKQFEAVLKQSPNDFDAHLNLSQVLVTAAQPQIVLRALKHAQRATEIKPLDPKAHASTGQCLQRLGKPDDAIPAFEKAFQYDSRTPEFALLAGQAELAAKKPTAAEKRFRALLARSPNHSSILLALAQSLVLQNKEQEAIPLLEQAAKVRPATPQDRMIAEQKLKELNAKSAASSAGPEPLK